MTRSSGHLGYGRRRERENENGRHRVGAGQTLGGIVEHLDERVPGRRGQDLLDVTQREADSNQHKEA